MSPGYGNSYDRGDQVDGLFAESDEELEAALSQELIELAGPDQHPQTDGNTRWYRDSTVLQADRSAPPTAYAVTRPRPKSDRSFRWR